LATQAKPDYYELLAVSRTATEQEIRAAFHRVAAIFYAAGMPKNIDDVEEIRSYVTAYRVLSDPEKRAYYDRTGFPPPATQLDGDMEPVAEEQINSFRKKLGDVAATMDMVWGLLELFG
jgi:DnaJ-class molecular chaperone